jgi:uncharacterized protein YjbI with pentapeptide repeats
VVLDRYAGSWFIVDSSNTVIVSVMVEEKDRQTADKKEGRKPWTLREFGGKTIWDWLHLLSALAIPVVLAAAGLWFTAQQDQRQVAIEDQRTTQAQKIENKRAEAERELAQQRAQDEALQAYLSQMSSLLLEKDLRESAKDSEVRTLARARTLTVLSRLDSARKQRLLQFLYEAGLLNKENPVIALRGADLSGIDLHLNNLSGGGAFLLVVSRNQAYSVTIEPSKAANLSGAILSDADLERAYLNYTDLSEADLSDADLSNAWLSKTDLSNANLSGANLSHADLGGADLFGADLSDADLSNAYGKLNLSSAHLEYADLSGVTLIGSNLSRAHLHYASLSYADLSHANLRHADLSRAHLTDTDLSHADLSHANLSHASGKLNLGGATLKYADLSGARLKGANLSDANLNDASGITNEELEQQAASLEGATMPNGQKYEEWLKSKGSEEGGENSGTS